VAQGDHALIRANYDQRWIFYINFPFIGVGGVLVILFLKFSENPPPRIGPVTDPTLHIALRIPKY
jgi:hypothetical protein